MTVGVPRFWPGAPEARREPAWRRAGWRHETPDALVPWIALKGSLTARLKARCPGQFRVEVLSRRHARPKPSEARALNVAPGRHVYVREVRLLCGPTALVWARTVVPHATIEGSARRFRHLGSRSLGALLFALRGRRRGALEVARIDREGAAPVWGRRTVHRLSGAQPMMVCEYFLPEAFGA